MKLSTEDVYFERIAAGMPVNDILECTAFYVDILGFQRRYSNEDYVVLQRDNVSIHLSHMPHRAGTGFCSIVVRGVDTFYTSCIAAGVKVNRMIENSSYGMRDFVLLDPAGNSILVGELIES